MNPLHEVQETLLPSVWGSSPTFSILPPRLGARELRASAETAPVGFAPLYPPYTWIPASARMTRQVQQDAAGVWGVPNFFILPPRMGAKGLKTLSAIRDMHQMETASHGTRLTVEGRC
jgi:hypothetical protein